MNIFYEYLFHKFSSFFEKKQPLYFNNGKLKKEYYLLLIGTAHT